MFELLIVFWLSMAVQDYNSGTPSVGGTYGIPVAAAGGGCVGSMASITLWMNWDDAEDDCSTPITANYSPDATTELSPDADIDAIQGVSVEITDDVAGAGGGGLSGSACAIYIDNDSDSSWFRIDNFNASSQYVPETEGRIAIEFQNALDSGCTANLTPWPCCTDEDTGTCEKATGNTAWFDIGASRDITFRAIGTTDTMDMLWDDEGIDALVYSDGTGDCDLVYNDTDTDVHLLEMAWDTVGGTLEIWVDGTSCDTDVAGVNIIEWIEVSDDIMIGPQIDGLMTMVVDRIVISNDKDEDLYDLLIAQGCQSYDAP